MAVLANLGQQTGRETATPLLEDYLLARRGLQTYLTNELKNATTGVLRCPADLMEFQARVAGQLLYLQMLQSRRGQRFEGTILSLTVETVNPSDGKVHAKLRLGLTGGPTIVGDEVEYTVNCKF